MSSSKDLEPCWFLGSCLQATPSVSHWLISAPPSGMCSVLTAPPPLVICKPCSPSHDPFHLSWRSALLSSMPSQRELCNKLARGRTMPKPSLNLSIVPYCFHSYIKNTSTCCVILPLFGHWLFPSLWACPSFTGGFCIKFIPRWWMLPPPLSAWDVTHLFRPSSCFSPKWHLGWPPQSLPGTASFGHLSTLCIPPSEKNKRDLFSWHPKSKL